MVLIPFSCAPVKKEIIRKSTIKIEGVNNNIEKLIKINGYYSDLSYNANANLMFFADGTYVWQWQFNETATRDSISNNMTKSLRKWIEGGQVRWGSCWGVYRIEGDTIIGHSFTKRTLLTGWSFWEEKYKIIDSTTVQKISWKGLLKIYEDHKVTQRPSQPAHFIPADSLPSSDNWLKEEKFIWRNELDWMK